MHFSQSLHLEKPPPQSGGFYLAHKHKYSHVTRTSNFYEASSFLFTTPLNDSGLCGIFIRLPTPPDTVIDRFGLTGGDQRVGSGAEGALGQIDGANATDEMSLCSATWSGQRTLGYRRRR